MKGTIAGVFVFALLSGNQVIGQERPQKEGQKEAPSSNSATSEKAESMKCCESIEKMGEMKDDMPKKTEMKAKMEKMKAMKEKMTEKMKAKSMEGAKTKDTKSEDKNSTPNKEEHQH